MDFKLIVLSEEDRRWFMEAMQSQTVDVTKRMKEITLVMQTPEQVLESQGVTPQDIEGNCFSIFIFFGKKNYYFCNLNFQVIIGLVIFCICWQICWMNCKSMWSRLTWLMVSSLCFMNRAFLNRHARNLYH